MVKMSSFLSRPAVGICMFPGILIFSDGEADGGIGLVGPQCFYYWNCLIDCFLMDGGVGLLRQVDKSESRSHFLCAIGYVVHCGQCSDLLSLYFDLPKLPID
jgi:hypothetical protein